MEVAAVRGGLIIFNSLTLFLQRFYSLLQKHVTQLMWSLETRYDSLRVFQKKGVAHLRLAFSERGDVFSHRAILHMT